MWSAPTAALDAIYSGRWEQACRVLGEAGKGREHGTQPARPLRDRRPCTTSWRLASCAPATPTTAAALLDLLDEGELPEASASSTWLRGEIEMELAP